MSRYYFSALRQMARINEVLEFMKTLIQSTVDDTLQISKRSLSEIQTCLYNAQEKIDFLQLESQLRQEELHQNRPINSNSIMLQFIQIKQQGYMQMQKFSLHFPSPSLDLGNILSTTSTERVLDMTRTCPFIFQTTQSPFSFRVLDSFMTVHLLLMTVQLQLFQILLLFHCNNNNNRL